jgi:hypothetical protein
MSSMSSTDVTGFSGLGVGCTDCGRGTLLKNDVMGLYVGLGLAGDLAGDFLVVAAAAAAAALGSFGDAARVCERVDFFVPAPFDMLVSVPLLGRDGGGEFEASSSSESDESTIGFFRVARTLTMLCRGIHSESPSTAH